MRNIGSPAAAVVLFLSGCATMAGAPKFPPATPFELERYLGTWYEIARLPNSFEKGLTHVTATYSLRDDGKVNVLNQGRLDGDTSAIVGKAKIAGDSAAGHLKVSFFWIFYSDYIVVEVDSSYTHALVAGGSHKYLWILARAPMLDPAVCDRLVARAAALGFNTGQLYFTPQN
ncbi:MAG: lipocalin [Chitinivibrionales bacterium]|nr:lipocalin [Chitinivibrionales bacterium]MBD3394635.1 lipocalin [Chitinivibrionales bacterium]